MHCHSKWKLPQDIVYWIHLALAQEEGLEFGKTRSHATIVHDPVPADCIAKVACQGGDKTLKHRLSRPRPSPKTILKDVYTLRQQQQQQQHQQDTLRSPEKPLAEQHQGTCRSDSKRSTGKHVAEDGNSFMVDLRIQGSPKDAVLEDQGRTTKIQEMVDTLRTGYQSESIVTDLGKRENSTSSVKSPEIQFENWET